MGKNRILFVVLFIALILATGCNRFLVGPTETENRSIEVGQAESVQVNIEMGVGELDLSGGAPNLLDAEFVYNIAEWKPEVEYDVNGERGRLTISQPPYEFEGIPDDNVTYEWDLNLNDEVPINLDIDLGIGGSDLKLNGLNLTELDVNTGVGETIIDLSGDWAESFDVNISGGIGDTTVIVPREAGVFVKLQTGLTDIQVNGLIREGDDYRNDAYGSSDVTLNIDVDGGIGQITLRLAE